VATILPTHIILMIISIFEYLLVK